MTDTNPRDLIQRLADAYAYCIDEYMSAPSEQDALIAEARAYLAQPEPDAPTDEELLQFLRNQDRLRFEQESPFGGPDYDGSQARAARVADIRAVLARWGK